jgi:hypothetical protein
LESAGLMKAHTSYLGLRHHLNAYSGATLLATREPSLVDGTTLIISYLTKSKLHQPIS